MRDLTVPRLSGRRLVLTSAVLFLGMAMAWAAAPAQPKPAAKPVAGDHSAKMARGLEIFKKHVRPVLVQQCVQCHSGDKVESGLDLTTREALLKGGDTGPAVLPGDAKNSLLYQLVTHAKKPHMPKKGPKLPDSVISQIAEWIDSGAPYDKALVAEKAEKPAW